MKLVEVYKKNWDWKSFESATADLLEYWIRRTQKYIEDVEELCLYHVPGYRY